MATITVVATVEPNATAAGLARVRVDVADSGTPAVNSVTVVRTDASGTQRIIRTLSGTTLDLVDSGSGTRTGTVYDYESPFGLPVTYSTQEAPESPSAAVTIDEDRIWLIHPGVPDRSRPIELKKGSNDEESEDVDAGVFRPLGRRNAVIVSDGQRKGIESELVVGTATATELTDLRALLADAFPLLLNIPPSMGLLIDTDYVFINALKRKRLSDVGDDPQRVWSLPYQVVDMPVGGAQSDRTWQSVIDGEATWADVIADFATWADVQAPTS